MIAWDATGPEPGQASLEQDHLADGFSARESIEADVYLGQLEAMREQAVHREQTCAIHRDEGTADPM